MSVSGRDRIRRARNRRDGRSSARLVPERRGKGRERRREEGEGADLTDGEKFVRLADSGASSDPIGLDFFGRAPRRCPSIWCLGRGACLLQACPLSAVSGAHMLTWSSCFHCVVSYFVRSTRTPYVGHRARMYEVPGTGWFLWRSRSLLWLEERRRGPATGSRGAGGSEAEGR